MVFIIIIISVNIINSKLISLISLRIFASK